MLARQGKQRLGKARPVVFTHKETNSEDRGDIGLDKKAGVQPCDAGAVDLELLATPCPSPLAPLLGSDPCCCWPSDLFNPRPGELLCAVGRNP